jgi:cytidylate kinase
MTIPVIAIDGPSASGKGTVAAKVAERLGFHYLDSGALYRLTALAAREEDIDWEDRERLAEMAAELPARFEGSRVFLFGEDVSDAIREEAIGNGASIIAAYPEVRSALLERQREFCQAPGLVADGRDMGSVVFPEATLKIFLTASAEERAQRRYKQLINKGESANLPQIQLDIIERDARDAARPVAPLKQEPDAKRLDTTALTIDQAVETVLTWSQSLAISSH